jgi:hypothetical protein
LPLPGIERLPSSLYAVVISIELLLLLLLLLLVVVVVVVVVVVKGKVDPVLN